MITEPPVKINLGLNVLRKREDGYHDLETLFYPCKQIHDTLEIIKGDDYSRTSARLSPSMVTGPRLLTSLHPRRKSSTHSMTM